MRTEIGRRSFLAAATATAASVVSGALGQAAGSAAARGDEAALRARILKLFGPATPMSKGGDDVFAAFDSQFRRLAEWHWTDQGANWESANYYDRARIYYVAWARSGIPDYLQRAHALAVNYRDGYLAANKYQSSAHWAQMAGVLLHYEATGDESSRTAVLRVAETLSAPYYIDNLDAPSAEMDNRIQARVLTSLLYAREASRGRDRQREARLATMLRAALAAILRSQSADGAFRFDRAQCGGAKPFMTGILNDALIEYHDLFEQDPAIAPAIRRSVDYLFANVFDPASRSFWYLERDCGAEKREPSPDLNLMIVNGFGFTHQKSGEISYREQGDMIFAAGVRKAWLRSSKTFNENYATAYRYLAYRVPR